MNWDDANDVIDLSRFSPPPRRRFKKATSTRRARALPAPDSDVIVVSDTEDEGDIKSTAAPVRHVLSEAQMNLPGPAIVIPPVPGPSAPVDPFDAYIARVLEIIPDVETAHLRVLLEKNYPVHGSAVVENVLHTLFEDASYPRVEKATGKRKRTAEDEEGPEKAKLKFDYASKDRESIGGANYGDLAMSQLLVDFPFIPKPHIRITLYNNNSLYAPTHLFLAQESLSERLPYKTKAVPSRMAGKGKQLQDIEFDKERAWLLDHLAQEDKPQTTADGEEEDEECEDGIECGCCFSAFAFDKIIQCPEAHLFCRSCCRSYATTKLGEHDLRLHCMDQSGCKELFPESELARFLPATLLALYHRLKQQKEVAAAGLEGLEECPFCEYKVVIENPDEKLFRCENAECGIVSCRSCKKADHVPKSCKEMEADKHLSVRHAIEEAMTKALMRNCPKCQKGFVKEHGCNKMTCPNCSTLSCYICRQVIIGYDHFGQPPPYSGAPDPNKCNLWDPVEQRHNNEVIAAAKKAVEEYKALHPDVSDEALNVDLPSPVRNSPAAPAHLCLPAMPPVPPMQLNNMQWQQAWQLPVLPRQQAVWRAPLPGHVPLPAPTLPRRRRR